MFITRARPQPTVWLMKYGHAGDFNNGLAVAKALSPDRYMVVEGPLIGDAVDKDSLRVRLLDPRTDSLENCIVQRKDFPQVFINSSSGFSHTHIRDTAGKLPVFDKTLVVRVNLPDGKPDGVASSDMNVVFRHQLDPDNPVPNAFIYDTVPTRINAETLKEGKKSWQQQLSGFSEHRPVYCVILGERLDHDAVLTLEDAKKLSGELVDAIKKTGGSVLLTTSPRTQKAPEIIAAFTEALAEHEIPAYCYQYDSGKPNPYYGLLATADKIIVTNDSMSMASDALATGKPAYLFKHAPVDTFSSHPQSQKFGHEAHNDFLLDNGLILPMERLAEPAAKIKPINSTEQIAADIRTQLALKQQRGDTSHSWVNATEENASLWAKAPPFYF